MVTGDDLIVTNIKRLEKAIKNKSVNSVIVKPNQIGSLIETKKFIEKAKKNKIYMVISHRSGETMDASISHLAVGFDIPMIKCGISGKERIVEDNIMYESKVSNIEDNIEEVNNNVIEIS